MWPIYQLLNFLETLHPAKIDNSCGASLLAAFLSFPCLLLWFLESYGSQKMYGKTWNSTKIFSILDSRRTYFYRNPRCQFRDPPQTKLDVFFLKSQSACYYRVAILTHALLVLITFQQLTKQSLYDLYHLILCYQTLTNIISASTKHSLCKHCFRVFVRIIAKLHKVLLSTNAAKKEKNMKAF